jgi:hypothetical protein
MTESDAGGQASAWQSASLSERNSQCYEEYDKTIDSCGSDTDGEEWTCRNGRFRQRAVVERGRRYHQRPAQRRSSGAAPWGGSCFSCDRFAHGDACKVPHGVPPARGLVLVDSANRLELMTAQRGLGDVEAATDIACRKAVGYTGGCRAWAHVAQEAEHNLGKIEVPGSSPGVGSRSRCSSAVEQLFRKQQAVGSNPTTGSTKNRITTRNR